VLRVLEIVLRHHPIASSSGVAREGQVFFVDLVRGAADPGIRTIAVEGLVAVRDVRATTTATAAAPTA